MKFEIDLSTTFSLSTKKSQKDKFLVIEKVLSLLQKVKNEHTFKKIFQKVPFIIQELANKSKKDSTLLSAFIDVDSVSKILSEFYESLSEVDSEKTPLFLKRGYLQILCKANLNTLIPNTVGLLFSISSPFHKKGETKGNIFIDGKGKFLDRQGKTVKFSFSIEYECLEPNFNLSAFFPNIEYVLNHSNFDDSLSLKISVDREAKKILQINLKHFPLSIFYSQINNKDLKEEDILRILIKILYPFSGKNFRQDLFNKIKEYLL